jgi:hypothetical protein
MINFNEISDIVPEREKIKQLLLYNSCNLLAQVIQDALVNDAALVELQKLLVKAAQQDTTEHELEQEYKNGYNDGYADARDEYQ